MIGSESRPPLGPGEPAPDFVLPAVDREGTVSLADYRGKTPVLLAMMRGLYCAFCRRHIAQLGTTRQKLLALGVEALAIVGMQPERVRLYYRLPARRRAAGGRPGPRRRIAPTACRNRR